LGPQLVLDLSFSRGYGHRAIKGLSTQLCAAYAGVRKMENPFALTLAGVHDTLANSLDRVNADRWRLRRTASDVADVLATDSRVVFLELRSRLVNGAPARVLDLDGVDAGCVVVLCERGSGNVARLPLAEYAAVEPAASAKLPTLMLNTAVQALSRYNETKCWVQALASSIPHKTQRAMFACARDLRKSRAGSSVQCLGLEALVSGGGAWLPCVSASPSAIAEEAPLLSCLCVTKLSSLAYVTRAIDCFASQTYPRASLELILVYDGDHPLAAELQAAVGRHEAAAHVRLVPVAERALGLTLGDLRNEAVRAARGAVLAQWDDDDFHAPGRLAVQLGALQRFGAAGAVACVMQNWMLKVGDEFIVCRSPGWPGSLMCAKAAWPRYEPMRRSEDTKVLERLRRDPRNVVALVTVGLYVYECHNDGSNAWERPHFETLVRDYDAGARFSADEVARLVGYRPVAHGVTLGGV
jgi:hypothetical protein